MCRQRCAHLCQLLLARLAGKRAWHKTLEVDRGKAQRSAPPTDSCTDNSDRPAYHLSCPAARYATLNCASMWQCGDLSGSEIPDVMLWRLCIASNCEPLCLKALTVQLSNRCSMRRYQMVQVLVPPILLLRK